MFTRRGVLAAAPAAIALSGARSVAAQTTDRDDARERIVVSALFDQLKLPPSRWKLDDLLHEVITYIDLNNADFGQASGPQDTKKKLIELYEVGDLNLVEWPDEANVLVRDDWTVFATALPPRSPGTMLGGLDRPIAFGFQLSHTPQWEPSRLQVSIFTIMRPFEPSFSAARAPCR